MSPAVTAPLTVAVVIPRRAEVAVAATAGRATGGRTRAGDACGGTHGLARGFALLALLLELQQHVAKLVVAQVHLVGVSIALDEKWTGVATYLTTEMVGETTIRVEDGEVSTTNVTDTELLVTRRARRIGELLEFSLEGDV